MPIVESDESDISQDESENEVFNDELVDLHDEIDDEDYDDFTNTSYFRRLIDDILGQNTHDEFRIQEVDLPPNYSPSLAMNFTSNASLNRSVSNSKPFISDALATYLTAPPLMQTHQHNGRKFLSMDPISNITVAHSLSTSELFVGNIERSANWRQLKEWFDAKKYPVNYIQLKKKNYNSVYAFVRFDSIETAAHVLYASETNQEDFTFRGRKLNIARHKRASQPSESVLKDTQNNNNSETEATFKITDVYHGTLITGTAMKNIQVTDSIVFNTEGFGIIANRLEIGVNASVDLKIKTHKKKLAIVVNFTPDFIDSKVITTELSFEWSFRDLKRKKVSPVLINHNDIFLLVEIKRPPIILETRETSGPHGEVTDENRLPGFGLIGHANVWLFKLSLINLLSEYTRLFRILRRHNLSPRQFSEDNIIYLIKTIEVARERLEPVQLISNDEWINKNQQMVKDFFQRRWPSYPFETKFEIMKLISKHIITAHDLIVDENAEKILKLCSINTLTAMTDKIVEIAPRWFATTCENDDEIWNDNREEENQQLEHHENQATNIVDNQSASEFDSFAPQGVRSCTNGTFVDAKDTDIMSLTTAVKQLSIVPKKIHIGTFSRLLIAALKELIKKYELRKTKKDGIFVTKLELRTARVDPSLIRKVYITPSTILYEGPYREEKCFVTRHFEKYQDRFLRVSFRDEDYGLLHNYNDNMNKIYERIKKILLNGIDICDRHCEFLAFSSSQLREHSCWMFAADNSGNSVYTIREWMGDFRNVRPVAKYAARLGQSFSTTIKGISIERSQIRDISDVKRDAGIGSRRSEHCFTDGIGIISKTLANKLALQMKQSECICPCAFQIRCGGYKGMVCLDVANCIQDPRVEVNFRYSMKKFDANSFSIDVIRTSSNPSPAYFNRQIILLLSSLGIPHTTFISFQDQMIENLEALTKNADEARKSLKALNQYGANGYHEFLTAYLGKLGEKKDPFCRQLLHAFQAFHFKELRTKAKILVSNSWILLGVIDETRTLEYGQVFIQIEKREESFTEILQGPVIVTRNPCFHPGDIRKLNAVDVPALHGLKNVIVFPMKGLRPHPMEMSGGDLDGDTFWISRHPDLLFSQNEEPFDYQGQEDETNDSQSTIQPTIEDVCNFFGEYIAADNLGMIANSHLALADQLPLGPKDEKCLQLARMHSIAVDFAKKGVNAPRLTKELRPSKYPHYMEKTDKTMYESDSILGHLYDNVKTYSVNLNFNVNEELEATSSFPYNVFFVNGSEEYMKEASTIKSGYDRDLKRIMRQYGIRQEAEIVSGYIIQFTSKQYVKQTKIFDLRNEIAHACKVIQEKYLRLFWEQFYVTKDESSHEGEGKKWSDRLKQLTWKNQLDKFEFEFEGEQALLEEVKKKASAWFRVTYEPWIIQINKYKKTQGKNLKQTTNQQQKEDSNDFKPPLFSFAWIVYPVLLDMCNESYAITEPTLKRRKRRHKKNKKKR